MKINESKLIPSERICEKIFACKGTKIFTTNLEYEFNINDATVYFANADNKQNKLIGTVEEILDYASVKFAKVKVGEEQILVKYDGNINDEVVVDIDVDKFTIIDKSIDIIIV